MLTQRYAESETAQGQDSATGLNLTGLLRGLGHERAVFLLPFLQTLFGTAIIDGDRRETLACGLSDRHESRRHFFC